MTRDDDSYSVFTAYNGKLTIYPVEMEGPLALCHID